MSMTQRIPLYYTFGNHMHWVDMQWLWGYAVLPDSVRDMLYFCRESGAKGNLNFDGIGYEKMAVEAPDALNELRQAVAGGQIEIVGASYGQPYGLFHGGESNVRQRIYGVRTVMRLLGVRPKTFWEEEFDFFPQLPQILRGAGYEYGSLFFQWTWHTPALPHEKAPAIWWEGMDGSRLLAAPRNDLNLHQWPEDFANLLENPLLREMPAPGIVQWLELMPSPDWMCRAELLLPQLKALMAHPAFEIKFATLSEYLDTARDHAVPRRYAMDDVFHGMSLGKNGDKFRRLSRRAEQNLLAAESLAALSGLFGRPYPNWDVYPTWELEEAWRELLSAQHHDNDECEGLCGYVGERSYERSLGLSQHITARSMRLLAERAHGPAGRVVAYNPLGWQRDAAIPDPQTGQTLIVKDVPPFGYRVVAEPRTVAPEVVVEPGNDAITLRRGALRVVVDRARGIISQIFAPEFPDGMLRSDAPLAELEVTRNGQVERFPGAELEIANGQIEITRRGRDGALVKVNVSLPPDLDAVDIRYTAHGLPRPDPRMHAALQTTLASNLSEPRLIHDHPYGVSEIKAEGNYLRKYPTGHWMTSPQVFEDILNPFTALQFVDLDGGERGLLYLHDGSQAFFRESPEIIRNVLSMYDAWDEDYFVSDLSAAARLVPHGPISHERRWKLAQEFTRPVLVERSDQPGGGLPSAFGSMWCDAPGTAVTAFYRETEESGAQLSAYAGKGMGFPFVIRLVELNGQPTSGLLHLPGRVAAALRTNLMGEPLESLEVRSEAETLPGLENWSQIPLTLRPHEIVTIYTDVVMGRKMPRNLDSYRHVWATVHRVDQE